MWYLIITKISLPRYLLKFLLHEIFFVDTKETLNIIPDITELNHLTTGMMKHTRKQRMPNYIV